MAHLGNNQGLRLLDLSSFILSGFLSYNPASDMYSRINEGSHKRERVSQISEKQNVFQISSSFLLICYCRNSVNLAVRETGDFVQHMF